MGEEILVVKIGGSTLGSKDTTLDDLVTLQREGRQIVVVHGGGQAISAWQRRLSLPVEFVQGLRVTNADSLEVVLAVLAGIVNKELVAGLLARGGRALGISGVDGAILKGEIRNPLLGYVGEVTEVQTQAIMGVLSAGFMPVIAPVGLASPLKADTKVPYLNFNADTAAGEIALALEAKRLVFLTDVPGVYDRTGKILAHISLPEARRLVHFGVITGGMVPKVEACLRALKKVPVTHIVDGREPHALISSLEEGGVGTKILPQVPSPGKAGERHE